MTKAEVDKTKLGLGNFCYILHKPELYDGFFMLINGCLLFHLRTKFFQKHFHEKVCCMFIQSVPQKSPPLEKSL